MAIKKKFLLVIFILILISCNSINTVSEVENNNSLSRANIITPERGIKGKISGIKDRDYFFFEVKGQKEFYSASLSELDSVQKGSMILSLYDKNGIIKQVNDIRTRDYKKYTDHYIKNPMERIFCVALTNGRYWLRVSFEASTKNKPAKDSTYNYTLFLEKKEMPANYESEPNDKAVEANTLLLGERKYGYFSPGWNVLNSERGYLEEDWYKIALEIYQPSVLNIRLTPVPDVNSIIEIWDSFGGIKLKSINNNGTDDGEEYNNLGILKSTSLYITVKSKFLNKNEKIPYELEATLEPYNSSTEFEPNDTLAQSSDIKINSNVKGNISPKNDIDWYKLQVFMENLNSDVRISVNAIKNVNIKLNVYSSIGVNILSVDNMKQDQGEIIPNLRLVQDTYYITVSGSGQNTKDNYSLLIETIDGNELEGEINNSKDRANPIEFGSIVKGYISPIGDVDYFTFSIYMDRKVSINITPIQYIDIAIDIYSQDGLMNTIDNNTENLGENAVLNLAQGKYYIAIREKSGKNFNYANTYTLSIN